LSALHNWVFGWRVSVVECFETGERFASEALAHPGWRLCGLLLVQQAAVLDGLSLDALTFLQDGLTAAQVASAVGWDCSQPLMVALVVVVIDESYAESG
jgi:hypothetical protein